MHCGEFEDRLNDVLDQRQRPEWDPALDEHMGGCAACRETARAYRAVLDGFHALVAPRRRSNFRPECSPICRSAVRACAARGS